MGILEKLFGGKAKSEAKAEEKPIEKPITVSTEMLMTSQYPALYLKEKNSTYRNMYLQLLSGIGFSKGDAEKLFDFECGVIRKYGKTYLEHPQFVKFWFFGLRQPFFLQYPKTKEDILKEKFFTVSELCKLLDEAEWHYWNSHEREMPDEVWEEIFQWRIRGAGASFGEKYFMMIAEDAGIDLSSLAALSNAQGEHLSRYKWR